MDRARFDRRKFLHASALFAGGAAIVAPFAALQARAAAGFPVAVRIPDLRRLGYGPLRPVEDETTGIPLLELPDGFHYRSFGWTRDPMSDGVSTPPLHDGMGVVGQRDGVIDLIRNHEVGSDNGAFGSPSIAFDPAAGGGTTTLQFDTIRGEWLEAWSSISGTIRNCAGGTTPWGTWLSCEETLAEPARNNDLILDHGWIFEVPPDGAIAPVALKDMGRFVHEAVAVDPHTGYVYETEDRGTSGFYRFIPHTPGVLSDGGRLQMMRLKGRPKFDTRRFEQTRIVFEVDWVDIDDPQRAHTDPQRPDSLGVFMQGFNQGAVTFARLEGAWFGNDLVYFVATSGGRAGQGQVWEYSPRKETLRLVFVSPGREVSDNPDNVCISPRGGILLCADGGAPVKLQGLREDGQVFDFAVNNVRLRGEVNGFVGDFRRSEFAGATFSPDGKWLFANIQSPGITVAITGPWEDGIL